MAPFTEHTADAGGLKLHYLQWGNGPRTVVCLHGTSMQAHGWTRFATDLQPDYRVIALNMRGHGKSARASTPYTIANYRDDLRAFVDAIGLKSFCLVGSSLGTQVATAFAAANPGRVERLMLSDPSLVITAEAIEYYVKIHRTRPRTFATFDEASRFAHSLPQRSRFSEEMHAVTEQGDFVRNADGRWEWAYDLEGILETFRNLQVDHWPEIRAVQCPVLILHAETSHVLSSENARRLEKEFPKAKLVEMTDCSHTIWGDRPDELSRLAREFFKQ